MHSESTQLITFLSTSIDGAPRPSAMTSKDERLALAQHDRLLIETIEAENGELFKSVGRGIRAAFAEPVNAIRAALKGQMALQTLAKAGGASLLGKRVRIALHSGAAEKFEKLYSGAPITHLGALAEAGHGGQILVSETTSRIVRDSLPYQTMLIDLGRHGLNDSHRPVHIWQLRHPDLPEEFPALRTHNLAATNLPFHTIRLWAWALST